MIKNNRQSRRRFLRNVALASAGSGLMASHGKMGLIQSALAASNHYSDITDHKSLVCVYLFGGNDPFNMFVPTSTAGHLEYQQSRGALSIAEGALLKVAGNQHGFHPSMPNVRNMYDSGRLGVMANVGTLLQPTTRADVQNGTAELPRQLFSHSHQTEMWQTDKSPIDGIAQDGWGGRMADLLQDANSNPLVPPTYTLFGENNWQAGRTTQQFAMNTYNGAEQFWGLAGDNWPPTEMSRTQAWDNILNRSRTNILEREAGVAFNRARTQIGIIQDGLAEAPDILTPYTSGNYFASQLKIVAKMIAVRELLGMKRQMFFVALGNWDSHGNQLVDHSNNLALLDDGLNSFNDTMDELGVADSVVSFTMSEFGRTLTSNGDGTDHAWGTHTMLMGGPVVGSTIHGAMPSLAINGPDDMWDDGRIIPTTSLDQYAATLGSWMGVTSSDLNDIFPNLNTFGNSNLGFLL